MKKILMILEVSRKQDYIFSSRKLRENISRSKNINRVTGSKFFQKAAGRFYNETENLVYTGGGHTVLQFNDSQTAAAFARQVTSKAIREFDGMEIFVKQMPYDEGKTPGENLTALSTALEAKKALRCASFRQLSTGVEALDPERFQPVQLCTPQPVQYEELLTAPAGWEFPAQFKDLAGDDNFIAVVHVDGNAMGKRVQKLYQEKRDSWEACRESLQRFSRGIQADFERAFQETVEKLCRCLPTLEPPFLPIRPVILAGDDVCFVTAGSIGLECARVFLECLTALKNPEDGLPYAACAGVALVHQKYPFHQAYNLAEELCSNAKKFGAELDPEGRVSSMDWHIEFGQLKGRLEEIREDYESGDGSRLELRPVTVTVPGELSLEKTCGVRTYSFFRGMCQAMKGEYGNTARGKIKNLRTAFKQGKVESQFFLWSNEVENLMEHSFEAKYQTDTERMAQYRAIFNRTASFHKEPFLDVNGTERCLFFDAIELIDHCDFLEEVGE